MFKQDILKNKTALITGGGTGLGKAMASMFIKYGARVYIVSRTSEHLESACNDLGPASEMMVCDVRKPDQVNRSIKQIVDNWGHLDILVNNAAGNFITPTTALSPGGWKVVIDIVLNGTYYCSHFAGLQMIKQGYGKILNIIATYAWTGNAGTAHSASAKAGVLALTRTLAIEWGNQGIRVNALAPGPVDTAGARDHLWPDPAMRAKLTEKIPVRRFGEEDEIANAATYLVSDYADYINGEVLVIDGGMWLNNTMFDLTNGENSNHDA